MSSMVYSSVCWSVCLSQRWHILRAKSMSKSLFVWLHRRGWPQYISRYLRLTRNIIKHKVSLASWMTSWGLTSTKIIFQGCNFQWSDRAVTTAIMTAAKKNRPARPAFIRLMCQGLFWKFLRADGTPVTRPEPLLKGDIFEGHLDFLKMTLTVVSLGWYKNKQIVKQIINKLLKNEQYEQYYKQCNWPI